jgi:hypothetical protein
MKRILAELKNNQKRLEQSHFCLWLRSEVDHQQTKFLFAPTMIFFVLAVKDIFQSIQIDNPHSTLEKIINQHCEENEKHWRHYLRDLETLGFDLNYWNRSLEDLFKETWIDHNTSVKEMLYLTLNSLREMSHPLCSLAIIKTYESAFHALSPSLKTLTPKLHVFDQLKYFGKAHTQQDESDDFILDNYRISDDQFAAINDLTQKIFNHFDIIFTCWYEAGRQANFLLNKNIMQKVSF